MLNNIKNCDNKIRNLFNKYNSENSLPLEIFYNVIRKYNLKDALISIAEVSKKIYNENGNFHHFRPFALFNEKKEMLTTMSILSELVFHFINSNASDKNNSRISDKKFENVFVISRLCQFHLNYNKYSKEAFNLVNLLQILAKEQGNMQLPVIPNLSRNYLMFEKIINDDLFKKKRPNIPEDIAKIFETNVGACAKEYFLITFLLFVYIYYGNKVTFSTEEIQNLEWEKETIASEKIFNVIKYLAITYNDFKDLSRTNAFVSPLLLKPIIEFDDKRFDKYTIPNLSLFLEKCWNGLFYDIESLYKEKCGETCRGHFGYIFEEYVGWLLKYKFLNNKIWDEIRYIKNGKQAEFFDWILELDKNKIKEYYLIEVKSLEVPFAYIYEKSLDEYYKKRIIKCLKTVTNKLADITQENELNFLHGQIYYPIVVFKDLPFINSASMIELLLSILDKDDELYKLIKEQQIFMFNIDDFENFVEILDKDNFNIVKLFKEQQKDQSLNLAKIMQNAYGDTLLRNSLLEKTHNEIFEIIKSVETSKAR